MNRLRFWLAVSFDHTWSMPDGGDVTIGCDDEEGRHQAPPRDQMWDLRLAARSQRLHEEALALGVNPRRSMTLPDGRLAVEGRLFGIAEVLTVLLLVGCAHAAPTPVTTPLPDPTCPALRMLMELYATQDIVRSLGGMPESTDLEEAQRSEATAAWRLGCKQ